MQLASNELHTGVDLRKDNVKKALSNAGPGVFLCGSSYLPSNWVKREQSDEKSALVILRVTTVCEEGRKRGDDLAEVCAESGGDMSKFKKPASDFSEPQCKTGLYITEVHFLDQLAEEMIMFGVLELLNCSGCEHARAKVKRTYREMLRRRSFGVEEIVHLMSYLREAQSSAEYILVKELCSSTAEKKGRLCRNGPYQVRKGRRVRLELLLELQHAGGVKILKETF